MYSFSVQKNETELFGSSKVENLVLFSEHNEVQIQGRMKALFGEPLYETENYEDAYTYVIQATDSEGTHIYFTVYQGGSGTAIGAKSNREQLQDALEDFKRLLRDTSPVDFLYEGYYMDAYVKIKRGIQNGIPFFEETEIEEDA